MKTTQNDLLPLKDLSKITTADLWAMKQQIKGYAEQHHEDQEWDKEREQVDRMVLIGRELDNRIEETFN